MFLELSHFLVPLPVSSSCYYRDQDKLSETSTCFLVPNLHSECPVFTVSSYLTICNANSCFQLNAPADIPQETRTSECHWLKGCGTRLKAAGTASGRCLPAFPQSHHRWINLLCSGEKADAEQCCSDCTVQADSPAQPWGCSQCSGKLGLFAACLKCCHRIPPGSH